MATGHLAKSFEGIFYSSASGSSFNMDKEPSSYQRSVETVTWGNCDGLE